MVEELKQILALTARARDTARAGNFEEVKTLIDQRAGVLKGLISRRKPQLSDTQRRLAKEIVLCITELDAEIAGLVRQQIQQDNREMIEIASKLRVLRAYARGFKGTRRFSDALW